MGIVITWDATDLAGSIPADRTRLDSLDKLYHRGWKSVARSSPREKIPSNRPAAVVGGIGPVPRAAVRHVEM
jgi:hypothetical protein